VELNRYGYVAGNPVNRYDPSGQLLTETGMQYSEEEGPGEEGTNRFAQFVRNTTSGVMDVLQSLLYIAEAHFLFQFVPPELQALDINCYKRDWRGSRGVTVASSYAEDPWFRQVAAARGRQCPVFLALIRFVVTAQGGVYLTAGEGRGNHAERTLFDAYSGQIPNRFRPKGMFWSIGVSRGLCDDGPVNCTLFFKPPNAMIQLWGTSVIYAVPWSG